MTYCFDADLKGANGVTIPVYCEVEPAYVGGQTAEISISAPPKSLQAEIPINPCTIHGKSGEYRFSMEGVYWETFAPPTHSRLGLREIYISHIAQLTIEQPAVVNSEKIRFHLSPASYLRSESGAIYFGDRSRCSNLFSINLPKLGTTEFLAEWATTYHRDLAIPGATVNAGFAAEANINPRTHIRANEIVTDFKKCLDPLSIFFRQAVTLHGWSYTTDKQIDVWIDPLSPNVTPSSREERGDYIVPPIEMPAFATRLVTAFVNADSKIQSLARHICLALNPHVKTQPKERYLFMFAALERVVEFAWVKNRENHLPTASTPALVAHLNQLRQSVLSEEIEHATEISERIEGLVKTLNRPSIRDKFDALTKIYPKINQYSADIWPFINGKKNMRGLKGVRDDIAHGSDSFVPFEVVFVATWHLEILLERLIFIILEINIPDGIMPNSLLLQLGGRDRYKRDFWEPLRSKRGQTI